MTAAIVIVVVVALAAVGLWLAARDAITVCVLTIAGGRVRVDRGGLAPRILSDVRDMAAKTPSTSATVRIVRDRGRAEVRVRGAMPADDAQRLRNIVGSVPLAKLSNARRR